MAVGGWCTRMQRTVFQWLMCFYWEWTLTRLQTRKGLSWFANYVKNQRLCNAQNAESRIIGKFWLLNVSCFFLFVEISRRFDMIRLSSLLFLFIKYFLFHVCNTKFCYINIIQIITELENTEHFDFMMQMNKKPWTTCSSRVQSETVEWSATVSLNIIIFSVLYSYVANLADGCDSVQNVSKTKMLKISLFLLQF